MDKNYIKIPIPKWWQTLIMLVVLITVFRIEPMVVFEAIKQGLKHWLSG